MNKCLYLICCLVCLTFGMKASENDTIIFPKIAKSTFKNAKKLATIITADSKDDQERAYRIFYWIAHNIKGDVKTFNKETKYQSRTINKILSEKIAYSSDYALLFKELCNQVDIKAQVVTGYERNELYSEGMHFYNPNHTWNAVLLNNTWHIVDVANAAGYFGFDLGLKKKVEQKMNQSKQVRTQKLKFIYNFKPRYFMVEPEKFKLECLAADPIWQLTDTAMPLQIFEKTEKEINAFNEKYSKPFQDIPHLSKMSEMNETEAILDAADRCYKFNPRYTNMKALKHIALSQEKIDYLQEAGSLSDAVKMLGVAKNELEQSKNILVEQKAQIKSECAELQQINTEKSTNAIQFKQMFTAFNTKHIAEAKVKLSSGVAKMKTLKADVTNKSKKFQKQKSEINIVTNSSSKVNSGEVLKHEDSLKARKQRLIQNEEKLLEQKLLLEANLEYQNNSWNELKKSMYQSDSALNEEVMARSRKQNVYGDSINKIRSQLTYIKSDKIEILQNEYFDLYDSILINYENQKKLLSQRIDLANLGIQSCTELMKIQPKNDNLKPQFEELDAIQLQAKKDYINNSVIAVNYINGQRSTLAIIQKKYAAENKFFDALKANEDSRKKQLADMIQKKENLQKKHAQQNLDNVDVMKKNLTAKYNKLKSSLDE